MAHPPKTILICSCEDTMRLDTAAVKRGCRNSEIADFRHLCRAELDHFRNAAKAEGPLIVGCTQEAPLFSREAEGASGETGFRQPSRDRRLVGRGNRRQARRWQRCSPPPSEPAPAFPFVTLSSEGVILIYGRDELAVEAGDLLADHLDVTVMITKPAQITPPATTSFPIVQGNDPQRQGPFRRLRVDDRRLCGPPPLLARYARLRGSVQRR